MAPSILEIWLLQSAIFGAIILGIGGLCVRLLKQPVHRVGAIQWTFLACLTVPAVQQLDLLPHLSLNLIAHDTARIEATATNAVASGVVVSESTYLESTQLYSLDETQIDKDARFGATNRLGESFANDPSAFSSELANASLPPQVTTWFTWNRVGWVAKWTYLTVVAALAVLWAMGIYLRWVIVQRAKPADTQLLSALHEVAGSDVRGTRLLVSDYLSSPAMWGFLRPTIVIPSALASQTVSTKLRFGLAHEWSHVIRGDYLTHTICRLTKLVCFYQPVYWWMRNQLALSQDFLADAYAADRGQSAEDYAVFLVSLARGRSCGRMSGILCMAEGKSRLLQRVSRLLHDSQPLTLQASRASALITAVSASILVVTLGAVRLNATPAEEVTKSVAGGKAAEVEKDNSDKPAKDLPAPITYTGTVVDRETGKPISGATVKVWHDLSRDPKTGKHIVLETTEHLSDEDGRYSFTLPPEQVAQSSRYLEVEAFHPDYQPKGRSGYSHAMIVKNIALGEPPFYETIELSTGERVSLKVTTPSGQPAAGLRVQSYTKAPTVEPGRSFEYGAWYETETNSQGELSLMVPQGGDGVIWVYPKDFAAAAIRIGQKRGQLGDVTLQPGVRLSGRVVNTRGEPVPNVGVEAGRKGDGEEADEFLNSNAVSNGIRAATKTDQEGKFLLSPLPSGEYRLNVESRVADPTEKSLPWTEELEVADVFTPMEITIEPGVNSEPLEIRAVPHVIVRGRFFDSEGNPRSGHKQHMFARDNGQFVFSESTLPGKDGWFEFKFPHGADDATINLMTNEHGALRWRKTASEPLQWGPEIKLGKLEDDFTTLEIVRYTAPILLIKAVDEDGELLEGSKPDSKYATPPADIRMGRFVEGGDMNFEKQPDGRWRSSQMLPDEDVTISLKLEGYTSEPQTIALKEGETRELVITMSKIAAAE
ncbi:MAG: carboxypeptidase regulatory-like domain-containing protein [Pirellulaceae bacterium]|nr:carboxypeptidase regulatory-like domain-containing protein [Pirellulaceae bacterium]